MPSPAPIEYTWHNKDTLSPEVLEECSRLFSNHYGIWGLMSKKPGKPVTLKADHFERLVAPEGSSVSLAYSEGKLIGQAFSLRKHYDHYGYVTWVTQLVVHGDWRKRGIATKLLSSIWAFSDDYAWGLATANPYTVRTLEKATRRSCSPIYIKKNFELLKEAATFISYTKERPLDVTHRNSYINTDFYIDREDLKSMLQHAEPPRWRLGKKLPEGSEWLAFTFREQPRKPLAKEELEEKLLHSEQILQEAYGRMRLNGGHHWAQHAGAEVDFLIKRMNVNSDQTILDFGCGAGRHARELAQKGYSVLGVDFLEAVIEKARAKGGSAQYQVGDCRNVDLGQKFDHAICLYDVIGSHAEEKHNEEILRNLIRHVKPGGRAAISVMNMELTKARAKHRGKVFENPDVLLKLKPSRTMQQTGDVFNPDYYLIDTDTGIVYRKEQFDEDGLLSAELIIRDRRYFREELQALCKKYGLIEEYCEYVQAGRWDNPLDAQNDKAKEILFIGRVPE